MKRPQSVTEILTTLGYGAFATAAVLVPGCLSCVGNPAPPPRDADIGDTPAASQDTNEADTGNR